MERIVPDQLAKAETTGDLTLRLHLERYEFAAAVARPGRLLDIACGVGYGSRLLAERRPDLTGVIGVDLCEEAVGYGKQRYGGSRVSFECRDAMQFFDADGFDTIVSLETIEHLPQPAQFVESILRSLRPGGIFVASAPVTPSVDANPHHCTDFTERSFRRLFRACGLVELSCIRQKQAYSPFRVASRSEERLQGMRHGLVRYYLTHPLGLLRRVRATLLHGFSNEYLTIAWHKS